MIAYPHIDPVALQLGPIKIYWYGLMYVIGFAIIWGLSLRKARLSNGIWTQEQIHDLIFYAALGVIIGGRVGYMLFYDFANFIQAPWTVFATWRGGMSFHGGLLGVLICFTLYGRRQQKPLLAILDLFAPLIPLGLAAGRLGNFINGELWGRVTDVPWAMIFPRGGLVPRHPSQLYELLLEGILMFILLQLYSRCKPPRGALSAAFLLLYGVFRFSVEFFRQPDPQWGFVWFDWMTMGQILSLPLVLIGAIGLYISYRINKGA